jgi:RHS repeat-associated protein
MFDALGSTVALADGSAAIQTEYTYEPFGGTSVSGTSTSSAFGFTGREDDGTGLYFYRARYYDPRLQRFVGEDPIGFRAGDPNLHGYTLNSPTNFVDPTGEIIWIPFVLCAAGAGGSALADWMSGRKFDAATAAAWCAVGFGAGFAGAGAAAAAGYGAGASAAAATAAAGAGPITGFTRHGLNQVMNRGLTPQQILDAVRNPIERITQIDQFGRTSTQYIGPNATVVLNPAGKVITAWGTGTGPR